MNLEKTSLFADVFLTLAQDCEKIARSKMQQVFVAFCYM